MPDGVAAGGGRRRGEVHAAVGLGERGLDGGLDRAAVGRREGAGRPRLDRVPRVHEEAGPVRRQEDAVAVLAEVGVEHLARRQEAPRVVVRDRALRERRTKRPEARHRGDVRRVEAERRPAENRLDDRVDVRRRVPELAEGVHLLSRRRARGEQRGRGVLRQPLLGLEELLQALRVRLVAVLHDRGVGLARRRVQQERDGPAAEDLRAARRVQQLVDVAARVALPRVGDLEPHGGVARVARRGRGERRAVRVEVDERGDRRIGAQEAPLPHEVGHHVDAAAERDDDAAGDDGVAEALAGVAVREEHGRARRRAARRLDDVVQPLARVLEAELAGPQVARGLEEGVARRRLPPGQRQLPGEVAGPQRLQAPEVAAGRLADRGARLLEAVAAEVRREPLVEVDRGARGLELVRGGRRRPGGARRRVLRGEGDRRLEEPPRRRRLLVRARDARELDEQPRELRVVGRVEKGPLPPRRRAARPGVREPRPARRHRGVEDRRGRRQRAPLAVEDGGVELREEVQRRHAEAAQRPRLDGGIERAERLFGALVRVGVRLGIDVGERAQEVVGLGELRERRHRGRGGR